MGCDIHAYIESRPYPDSSPNYWWTDAELSFLRNYAMFNLLAGVRGDGNSVFPVRGWDKESSTKMEFCLYISNEESDYSCTKENADSWLKSGSSKRIDENWITHPDWHSASWLYSDEFERVIVQYQEMYPEDNIGAWIGACAMLKEISNSRIIFWFDN